MKKLLSIIAAPIRAVIQYRRVAKRRAFLIAAIEKADYQWRTLPKDKIFKPERRRLERQMDVLRHELEMLDGRLS